MIRSLSIYHAEGFQGEFRLVAEADTTHLFVDLRSCCLRIVNEEMHKLFVDFAFEFSAKLLDRFGLGFAFLLKYSAAIS